MIKPTNDKNESIDNYRWTLLRLWLGSFIAIIVVLLLGSSRPDNVHGIDNYWVSDAGTWLSKTSLPDIILIVASFMRGNSKAPEQQSPNVLAVPDRRRFKLALSVSVAYQALLFSYAFAANLSSDHVRVLTDSYQLIIALQPIVGAVLGAFFFIHDTQSQVNEDGTTKEKVPPTSTDENAETSPSGKE